MKPPYKTVVCVIATTTEKAILCKKKRKSGNVEFWLPKSQVEILNDTKVNNLTGHTKHYINMPEWLYDETFGSWDTKKLQQNPRARIVKGMNTNAM